MRAVVTLVVVVSGCGYQAGSFHSVMQPFRGERMTVGCIDLSIERRADLETGESVIAYSFGNRCDEPAVIDLANVAVIGRADAGAQLALEAFDPHHEIRMLRLDGRAVGHEAIAYPSADHMSEVCVDAGSITHADSPRWLCFGPQAQATQLAEVE